MMKAFWFTTLFCVNYLYAVDVTNIQTSTAEKNGTTIEISYQGRVSTAPHFAVEGGRVMLLWPEANLLSAHSTEELIVKNENTTLYMSLAKKQIKPSDISKLSIRLGSSQVIATIPADAIVDANTTTKAVLPPVTTPVLGKKIIEEKKIVEKPIVPANTKNEDYLSYLLSSVDKANKAPPHKPAIAAETKVEEIFTKKVDTVATAKATEATQKIKGRVETTTSSMAGYITRMALVLLFVVGIIFVLAKISKKLMLGKNKLGFLHNSKVVEVLNTTYIGPKRQLLLVKVYDQVILLSSAENGITFLSEVNGLPNILKMAEKEVTGDNFDGKLQQRELTPAAENRVVLKDHTRLMESKPIENTGSKMKLAIKNKVKSLKDWQ